MRLTDNEIIDALIQKDEKVTHEFFFVWCKPLLYSLIRKVFNYEVDYDELVNELYVHLMEDDARRLRSFRGRSSVYQWLKCVAIRFFIEKRDRVIEDKASDPLYERDEPYYFPRELTDAQVDMIALLKRMHNDKYRFVLEQYYLRGAEFEEIADALGTTTANVYNIKRRALTKLTVLVLDDSGYEQG